VLLKVVKSTPSRGGVTKLDIVTGPASLSPPTFVGPYMLGPQIAAGGMGSVRVGLKRGALGFQRLVAVKRLHPHLAGDANFVARFKDEIRLVSRLTHPNIVQAFDVIEGTDELALVMEYVDGVTLHELLRDAVVAGSLLPVAIAVGIVSQALHGLHAAHEATDDRGNGFLLVHRDVSPQNIMIGKDGLVKVLDFGVAKAASASHLSRVGQLSGKVSYMTPEQATGRRVDRRTDVFAAGVVLWETLCGRRLFGGPGTLDAASLDNVVGMQIPVPSELRSEVGAVLDRILLRALDRDPSRRFGSARDFALALEEALPTASTSAIAGAVATISAVRTREQQAVLASFRRQIAQAPPDAVTSAFEPRATFANAQEKTVADAGMLRQPTDLKTRPFAPTAADLELQTADVQSALSIRGASAATPPRRGVRLPFVTVAALIALGTAAHLVSESTSPPAGASAAKQTPPKPSPAEPRPNASPRVAAPTALAIEDLAALPAREAAPKPPKARKVARAVRAVRAAAPARTTDPTVPTAPPAPSRCSPPTYVDAEGIRHFKAECL
jgi:eukaryotic-like serine/threonine-protein kinase